LGRGSLMVVTADRDFIRIDGLVHFRSSAI
jgi:hypothetical protein